MLFLIVLVITTAATAGVLTVGRRYSGREAARIGMALAMAVAGIAHWVNPTPFLQHLPPWVPLREELILVTGVIEVTLGAALLLPPPWRRLAGVALAAYLVAVFPGNVYVAVAGVNVDGQPGGLYPWLRLPFQVLFIAWALWSTQDFRSSGAGAGARNLLAPRIPRSRSRGEEVSSRAPHAGPGNAGPPTPAAPRRTRPGQRPGPQESGRGREHVGGKSASGNMIRSAADPCDGSGKGLGPEFAPVRRSLGARPFKSDHEG